jgi:formylglycine-generating enzyme required for sulfatase activity
MKRTVATCSVGRGLSRVEPSTANTLIAFATKPNAIAEDGKGPNSPFTAALVKHLLTPGLDLRLALGKVRDEVMAGTGGRQEPYVTSSLGGEVVSIVPGVPGVAPPAAARSSEAAEAWAAVKDSGSVAELEVIAKRYKGTVYADLAQARIEELKKQQVPLASKAPPSLPPKTRTYQVDLRGKGYEVTTPDDVGTAEFAAWIKSEGEAALMAAQPKATVLATVGAFKVRALRPLTANEEHTLQPKDSFRECFDCSEMVVVPAGGFLMGSPAHEDGRGPEEGPRHRVTIAKPLAVGKFEVTFSEWDACVTAGSCKHRPDHEPRPELLAELLKMLPSEIAGRTEKWPIWFKRMSDPKSWGRGQRPVINVSWNDITKEYLPWLSRKTGKTYRLLTEAEWEYAARAGTTTRYAFGHQIGKKQAQYSEETVASAGATVAVGSFPANPFGLHDMHGNVWEWVQDCWNESYVAAPSDGSAWTAGDCKMRVLRGGTWASTPEHVRSGTRNMSELDFRDYATGFRVLRTLDR